MNTERRRALAVFVFVGMAVAAALSCATGDPTPNSGLVKSDPLESQLNTRVVLHGVARDAKGGAVVLMPSGSVVYIDGLSSWPPERHGKPVTVSGILRSKKYIPDPRLPDGTIVQGAEGEQYVLEGAQILP